MSPLIVHNRCLSRFPALELTSICYRIVCVDFDQTLVTTHTQGRWKKTASELATFTRPVIVDIIMSSLDCKVGSCKLGA